MDIDLVSQLVDQMLSQTGLITGWALGGVGVVLASWGALFGFSDSIKLTGFRAPLLLLVPLVLFSVSAILGFFIQGQMTGYYAEVGRGQTADGLPITDLAKYFYDSYYAGVETVARWQILSLVLAGMAISLWYVVNVLVSRQRLMGAPE